MANHKIAERLALARKAAGFDHAADAATALDTPYPTYASHENGTRGFSPTTAAKYARRFRVSLDWLLGGRGEGPAGGRRDPDEDIITKFRQLEQTSPEEADAVRRSVNRLLDGALSELGGTIRK